MPEVGAQPVRNIDCTVGDTAQREPQRDARLRPVQPRCATRELGGRKRDATRECRERERRIAEHSRDPHVIAGPRSVAPQCGSARRFAHDLHANVERAARCVTADKIDPEAPRERHEAARKTREPVRVSRGQRQRERRPAGCRAHRRQIGKIDRKRLVAELPRIGIAPEMAARDQHIGRDHEFASPLHIDERGIVTHAEHGMPYAVRKIAPDQFELG